MKQGPIGRFFIAWIVSGIGLFVAAGLLDERINYNDRFSVLIIAGFILAVANAIIRPLIVLISLPAILFTLGLFVIIINGFMVWLVSFIYPQLQVSGFGAAILAGMVIGLINYLVSTILERE